MSNGFAAVFLLIFSAAVTFAIGPLLGTAWLGVAEYVTHPHHYATTTGVIRRSALSHGDWSVRYAYAVDGHSYESTRRWLGAGDMLFPDREAAAFRAHPVGSAVSVGFDRAHPDQGALSTATTGLDVLMGFFLLSPTMFLLMPWFALLSVVRWSQRDISVGGCKVTKEGGLTRVRMPRYPPLQIAANLALMMPFLTFLVAFVVGAFAGGLSPILAGVVVLAAVAVIVGWPSWITYGRFRGDDDLIIEPSELSVPPLRWRRARETLRRDGVIAYVVDGHYQRGRGGGWVYRTVVRNASGPDVPLAQYPRDHERAEALARWLGMETQKEVRIETPAA